MPEVQGSVHPELTLEEVQRLAQAKANPEDFCSMTLPCMGLQAIRSMDRSTGEAILVFTLNTHVPFSVLPLKSTGVLDAEGKASFSVTDVFRTAPDIRFVLRRDALSPQMRAALQAIEEQIALGRQLARGGLAPAVLNAALANRPGTDES
jgi:hypothetical protein